MRGFVLGFVCLMAVVGCADRLMAQDLSKLSETEKRQVNDWMAERAEKMIVAHKLEVELSQAWTDPKLSTPEIDTLRTRYRELQQELARTLKELKKKVQEVPAVQEKQGEFDEAKKRIQELSEKVKEKTGVPK